MQNRVKRVILICYVRISAHPPERGQLQSLMQKILCCLLDALITLLRACLRSAGNKGHSRLVGCSDLPWTRFRFALAREAAPACIAEVKGLELCRNPDSTLQHVIKRPRERLLHIVDRDPSRYPNVCACFTRNKQIYPGYTSVYVKWER